MLATNGKLRTPLTDAPSAHAAGLKSVKVFRGPHSFWIGISCHPVEAWACRERACHAKEVIYHLAEGSEGCPKWR
jgi:hypothetical protein